MTQCHFSKLYAATFLQRCEISLFRSRDLFIKKSQFLDMIWLVLLIGRCFNTLTILEAFADPKYVGFASGMTTAIAGVTRSRNRISNKGVELGWISYLQKNASDSMFVSCWTAAILLISWWHSICLSIWSLIWLYPQWYLCRETLCQKDLSLD